MARTVVAILDRDNWQANTDIIVVVDGPRRSLTWVPRDLWSRRLHDRVNAAFAAGECAELLATMASVGFPCDGALCIRRSAAEALLEQVDVEVPVATRMAFWYPLEPTRPIEEGRKQVTFEPPVVRLRGERVHQWIGARMAVSGPSSDFFRIERQQVLLRALLAARFDFRTVLDAPELIRMAGERPLEPLTHIDGDWTLTTFRAVRNASIEGKAVLIRSSRLGRLWRRLTFRIRS